MWHELVLWGVGGCTIEEAKERLSYREAQQWFAYIRKRGSLNLGRRIECGIGLLALMKNRAAGGSAEMEDFTPHEDKPEMGFAEFANAIGARLGNG